MVFIKIYHGYLLWLDFGTLHYSWFERRGIWPVYSNYMSSKAINPRRKSLSSSNNWRQDQFSMLIWPVNNSRGNIYNLPSITEGSITTGTSEASWIVNFLFLLGIRKLNLNCFVNLFDHQRVELRSLLDVCLPIPHFKVTKRGLYEQIKSNSIYISIGSRLETS